MKLLLKQLQVLVLTFGIVCSGTVFAIGSGNDDGSASRDFILNSDDESGDVALVFGGSLNEYLQWDDIDGRFELSDDLMVEGDIDFTGDLVSECGAYESYTVERGTVGSNQRMAYGNGRQTHGTPMGCSGTVTKIAAMCSGSIGASLNYFLIKNNAVTTCTLNNSTTAGQASIAACSESFLGTDVLNVRTGTETGAWTECVATFWVKYD